jgi:DNA ligase-1
MKAFSRLLDQLAFTPSRNAKLTLLRDYLGHAPDPERGWAQASLTGALSFEAAKPGFIRKAAESRLDPQLFTLSHDFIGDLAETVALVWPAERRPGERGARLEKFVGALDNPRIDLSPCNPSLAGKNWRCCGRHRRLAIRSWPKA